MKTEINKSMMIAEALFTMDTDDEKARRRARFERRRTHGKLSLFKKEG